MNAAYRVQLLRYIVTLSCNFALFVLASPTEILYTFDIYVSSDLITATNNWLEEVGSLPFTWLEKKPSEIPESMPSVAENIAGYKDFFISHYSQSMAVAEWTREKGRPVPPTK